MATHVGTLQEIFKPWYVRVVSVAGLFWGFVQGYDALSNQFPSLHLHKLEDAGLNHIQAIASILPWWGWLLAASVYALFEYVRRNLPVKSEGVTLTYDQMRDIDLDLIHLLYFSVDAATSTATKRLIDQAPTIAVPAEWDITFLDDARLVLKRFIYDVKMISGGSLGDGAYFDEAMRKAERDADDELAR